MERFNSTQFKIRESNLNRFVPGLLNNNDILRIPAENVPYKIRAITFLRKFTFMLYVAPEFHSKLCSVPVSPLFQFLSVVCEMFWSLTSQTHTDC